MEILFTKCIIYIFGFALAGTLQRQGHRNCRGSVLTGLQRIQQKYPVQVLIYNSLTLRDFTHTYIIWTLLLLPPPPLHTHTCVHLMNTVTILVFTNTHTQSHTHTHTHTLIWFRLHIRLIVFIDCIYTSLLPWCHLKTTNFNKTKSAGFETCKPFFFFFALAHERIFIKCTALKVDVL